MGNCKEDALEEDQENTQALGETIPKIRSFAGAVGDDTTKCKQIGRFEAEEISMAIPSGPNAGTSDGSEKQHDKREINMTSEKKKRGDKSILPDRSSHGSALATTRKRGEKKGDDEAVLKESKILAHAPPTFYVHQDEERKRGLVPVHRDQEKNLKALAYAPPTSYVHDDEERKRSHHAPISSVHHSLGLNYKTGSKALAHAPPNPYGNDEEIRPGPVRVRGVTWNGKDDDDYQPVSFGRDNNEIKAEIAEADLVDPEAEEARIIANIFRSTVKGIVVKESPSKPFSRRNAAILFFIVIIGIVVTLVFLFLPKSSSDEVATERTPLNLLSKISNIEDLLQDGSPQNAAYSQLLEESIFDEIPERIFTERYIALVLYLSTNGTHWNDNYGFKEKKSVCDWSKENVGGITCNEEFEIIMISLGNNNLSGTLPSELFQLSSLETLWLPNNEIHGSIPSKFKGVEFDLRNLAILDLSMNSLTGVLPSIFITSKTIRELNLGSNYLNGKIPDFKPFNGLMKLFLDYNLLTGTIPESISMLSSLTVLDLGRNKLSGSIPEGVGEMTSLERLNLISNFLSGSIPFQVQNLEDLRYIELTNNRLTGKIPDEIEEIKGLTIISFENNRLSGSIPQALGLLENIIEIDLSLNEFTGTLPMGFSSLKNLVTLEIDRNNITGSLDEMFCSAENQQKPYLKADCLGLNPEIECSCCDMCYDNAGHYVADDGKVCGFKMLAEFWLNANLKREAACDCVNEDRALLCKFLPSNPCESCSLDETICTTANELAFEIGFEKGDQEYVVVSLDFSYIKGLNNSISIRSSPRSHVSNCEVAIDGRPCESCELRKCGPSGQSTPIINCGIIDGVDYMFDGCADTLDDATSGIFSIVKWAVEGNLNSKESCLIPNVFDFSSFPLL